jgi:CheY-like chemotaxis protein
MIKKILIIDDEEIVRRALKRAFEKFEFQVELAENGYIGLNKWRDFQPDIILLDLIMPVMSGTELLNELANKQHCPIVVMSAFTAGVEISNLKQLGATSFIAKPFENIFNVVSEVEALIK